MSCMSCIRRNFVYFVQCLLSSSPDTVNIYLIYKPRRSLALWCLATSTAPSSAMSEAEVPTSPIHLLWLDETCCRVEDADTEVSHLE